MDVHRRESMRMPDDAHGPFRPEGSGPRPAGFMLIEAVVTLAVLAIAAVGVLSVFAVGIRNSADPLIAGQAISLAQGELDHVTGDKAANGFDAVAVGSPLPCVSSLLPGFACSRSIYYVNAANLNAQVAGPTAYKHVTVTITSSAGAAIALDTVIARY